uniref:(northern house mosquito) hypothetical protein n=1 Tax=Culex pipiens TaxID=7175 RepID=A0A8D8FPV0_CULPI
MLFGHLNSSLPETAEVGSARGDQVPLDAVVRQVLGDLVAFGSGLQHLVQLVKDVLGSDEIGSVIGVDVTRLVSSPGEPGQGHQERCSGQIVDQLQVDGLSAQADEDRDIALAGCGAAVRWFQIQRPAEVDASAGERFVGGDSGDGQLTDRLLDGLGVRSATSEAAANRVAHRAAAVQRPELFSDAGERHRDATVDHLQVVVGQHQSRERVEARDDHRVLHCVRLFGQAQPATNAYHTSLIQEWVEQAQRGLWCDRSAFPQQLEVLRERLGLDDLDERDLSGFQLDDRQNSVRVPLARLADVLCKTQSEAYCVQQASVREEDGEDMVGRGGLYNQNGFLLLLFDGERTFEVALRGPQRFVLAQPGRSELPLGAVDELLRRHPAGNQIRRVLQAGDVQALCAVGDDLDLRDAIRDKGFPSSGSRLQPLQNHLRVGPEVDFLKLDVQGFDDSHVHLRGEKERAKFQAGYASFLEGGHLRLRCQQAHLDLAVRRLRAHVGDCSVGHLGRIREEMELGVAAFAGEGVSVDAEVGQVRKPFTKVEPSCAQLRGDQRVPLQCQVPQLLQDYLGEYDDGSDQTEGVVQLGDYGEDVALGGGQVPNDRDNEPEHVSFGLPADAKGFDRLFGVELQRRLRSKELAGNVRQDGERVGAPLTQLESSLQQQLAEIGAQQDRVVYGLRAADEVVHVHVLLDGRAGLGELRAFVVCQLKQSSRGQEGRWCQTVRHRGQLVRGDGLLLVESPNNPLVRTVFRVHRHLAVHFLDVGY